MPFVFNMEAHLIRQGTVLLKDLKCVGENMASGFFLCVSFQENRRHVKHLLSVPAKCAAIRSERKSAFLEASPPIRQRPYPCQQAIKRPIHHPHPCQESKPHCALAGAAIKKQLPQFCIQLRRTCHLYSIGMTKFSKIFLQNFTIDKAAGDSCIVVEGVTDVWRLGPGAVATFGIKFRPAQVAMLARHFKTIHVLFDPEPAAQAQARKLATDISRLGCAVKI